jgi:hypothetical protein
MEVSRKELDPLESEKIIQQAREELKRITVFTHPFLTLRWTAQDRLYEVIQAHEALLELRKRQ